VSAARVLAYVGLGANLGEPAARIRWAAARLCELGRVRLSPLYRSEPLGDPAQPWYVNAVAELETRLPARALLAALLALETEAGRAPLGLRRRWEPRVLDLDLLLYGALVCDEPGFRVPHPGLAERRFVLEPLARLAPGALDPRSGRTALELLLALDDPLGVAELPCPGGEA
jgi:2-amino-4-hydroxy-6-hydroxymethyldihydropteridine diphosphokinase